MKKYAIIFLILVIITGGCKTSSNELSEESEISISGIKFTKSLNNAKNLATVNDGTLLLKSNAKTDYFNESDGKQTYSNAPVLLSKTDNTKPFTFSFKVTPTFTDTYDAGCMYIYLNHKNWFKFAFERDELKRTRMVTVRTIGTSDDNNHDVVETSGVYMKISSDTKSIGFYYSIDKLNWQLVRVYRNDYPAEIWLGLSSQSPIGKGSNAVFEDLSFTQSGIKDFRMGN